MGADLLADAGKEREHLRRHAGLEEYLHESEGDPGVCSAGLKRTALPVTSAALTMPVGMASGKFQGAITAPMPRGR
jgi:hypothetical protein